VDLRHPSLLPQSYLQVPLGEDSPFATRYKIISQSETEIRFESTREASAANGPYPVVVERFYAKPREAISDLQKGKLDAIDRVLPNDALRLRDDPALEVGTYAFPSIHVLVPNVENPHLANRTFRRALVYGINRQVILNVGLLNKQEVPGCQVLSAAIPAGVSRGDPSAYAYDQNITPLPYDPVMAAILMRLAQQQLDAAADKRQEAAPELGTLVLVHPGGEQANFVCKQIKTQLKVVGIACELRELPAGQTLPTDDKYDLLYAELFMHEPLVDLGRVFGPDGIAETKEPYVALALRQLDQAETWKDARDRLHELHRLLYEDMTVLPLWQMVDSFVHRKGLRGIPNRPIHLYQDVERWRISPPTPNE
jgi:ABC-type transport system substrate-binding protein